MSYVLGIQPATRELGSHDPAAAIFRDGQPVFGVEEERFTREKHAVRTFPEQSIRACLGYCDLELADVEKVVVPWQPTVRAERDAKLAAEALEGDRKETQIRDAVQRRLLGTKPVETRLADLGTPVPEIETRSHHRCHAASAFYPSGFDDALVLTIDGRGDRHSTVVWEANEAGLDPVRTYDHPNSLALFYGAVTRFLGYRLFNGEGKVMGLAPYGQRDETIEERLRSVIDVGVDYDVTGIVEYDTTAALENLAALFDRQPSDEPGEFDDWEKNLAHVVQALFEEVVESIVTEHLATTDASDVCLAGGGALNCKMNKRVAEIEGVDRLYVQPVAHDAGTAIGGGMLDAGTPVEMETVYLGPEFSTEDVEARLRECKLSYSSPDDLERVVAEELAEGALVGWFQGRLEMGPRALGNRSILADPRSQESKDRINRFVKHRENWRPFAPSVLEDRAGEYLESIDRSPFMIETFDVREGRTDEIPAVLHPGDATSRPQTVRQEHNERYYALLREFEDLTGVPVLLNTSFNDHGEPIVRTPREAIRDFFGMGLDVLAIDEFLVRK